MLRRSQLRRTGQICLIEADKPAITFLDIVPGGVMYGGGGLSGIRGRRSFPDVIEVV